jgi:hypothetical protein
MSEAAVQALSGKARGGGGYDIYPTIRDMA